jgi:hypothetical protein
VGVVAEEETKPPVFMPTLTFLYTLDQIAGMLGMTESYLNYNHIYFFGIMNGRKNKSQMIARNIAADDDKPDWRVSQQDFVRWLNANGFSIRWPAQL